ncbi:M1 family metallopeptidase [Nocardioides sp.]|uniref:M1 family metallopeptidase n=1 Tax=Nocardioides sp. TaxID=35761 RepID=UPI003D0EE7C4
MTRRRLTARIAAVVAVALTIPAGAAQAGGGIGAKGIGDPYYPDYGNGGYDVTHYGIKVNYRPATDRVVGRTMITATTKKRLTRFNLDLVLPASAVRVNGRPARFSQGAHELVVTPRRAIGKGRTMKVWVRYAGKPANYSAHGISPWITTKDGAAAVGEPEIAPWWFPANDHPRDKAKYDVRVTVPRNVEALGNGILVSRAVSGKQRTWHWREHKQMASYLAFFVAGQFDITRSRTADGIPVLTAVASNGGAAARFAAQDLARTPEVVDWHTAAWGPYPFDAMGGVAPAASFGFALENQTRPVYSRLFWTGGSNIYVVVHELAHQWFGDSVSVRNWRDIWLNEGFASFTEWLWSEQHAEGTAQQIFDAAYSSYPQNDSFWTVKIGNPGKGNEFNGAVYERGAMTLQALRNRIGDGDFFTVMRTWARIHKYENAQISQFASLAERVSGKQLDGFFRAWLYRGVKPAATPANGFPAGRTGARPAAIPSLAKIAAVQRLMSGAERR